MTCTSIVNDIVRVPYVLLTSPDKMDKSAVKFAEGIFKGISELALDTDFAAAPIFQTTSKWLTAVALFTDFKFWLEVKDGAYTFLQKEAMELYKRGAIHLSHLFTTLKLLKDCSVECLQYLDNKLGQISFLGTQLSFKVLKDYALLVASSLSLYPIITSFLDSTVLDNDGNVRTGQDFLNKGIFTDKFWNNTCTKKNALELVNNVTKIYVIAAIALNAPFDPLFFVMGALLGITNIMKYIQEDDKVTSDAASVYAKNKPDFARIPGKPERELFNRVAIAV